MMSFDLDVGHDEALYPAIGAIAARYFSLDTASSETANTWYRHNPSCVIVAKIGDVVHGYADFLPLTSEAKELIETRRLKEEEITPEHLLPPEALPYCRAIYFAGIAVRDKGSVLGARCAAALLAGHVHLVRTFYGEGALCGNGALECLYANPTTFSGNRLIQRMGLSPVVPHKRSMDGMDLYQQVFSAAHQEQADKLFARYRPFIRSMAWEMAGEIAEERAGDITRDAG